MSTPNLALAHIASNQASKEVTANAGLDGLDNSLCSELAHTMTDADYTLVDTPPTASEARYNLVFVFNGGSLTADRNIIVPNAKKLYIVKNATSGGHALTVKTAAGTGIKLANGGFPIVLYCDGTNVIELRATTAGVPEIDAADGAIAQKDGVVFITKGSAAALTLAAPTAGLPAAGGDDGKSLRIIGTTAFAHTVTTPANALNGNKHIATLANVGDSITLTAYNGVWYVSANTTTLS